MDQPTDRQRQEVEDLASSGASIAAIAGLTGIPENIIRNDFQAELLKARRKIFEAAWRKIAIDIEMKWRFRTLPQPRLNGIEPEVYLAQMATRLWAMGRDEPKDRFLDKRLVEFMTEFTPEMLETLSPFDLAELAEAALGESATYENVDAMRKERSRFRSS